MFLVMGITGRVGGATARHLLANGHKVRALVRDRSKANDWAARGVDLVDGDWKEAKTIERALPGVQGAFAMLPTNFTPQPDFSDARALIAAYAEAFAQAPPARLVALSTIGAERTDGLGMVTPLALMERAFRDLPSPKAFMRAGGFYENFLHGLRTGETGTLPVFYPSPTDRKVPLIATDDIGRIVADILAGPAWRGARVLELGTPVSADELAEQLSEVMGRTVVACARPRSSWAAALESMGLPHGQTWAAEEMFEAAVAQRLRFGSPGAERREGRLAARDVFAAARAKTPAAC